MLKSYTEDIPRRKINESELRIDFPHNKSRIQLFGADNPDALRGLGLNGVVFDEFSQQPSRIFTEIVSKCLADKLGYAVFIGTPQGKNEFYRIYQNAKDDVDWMDLFITIDDSLRNEKGQTIKNLKQALEDDQKMVDSNRMELDEFNQEWYCSFEASVKGAYYAKELQKTRQEHRITTVVYQPEIPVYTFWDLGISDTTAIIFAQFAGQEIHIIDCYENSGYGLDHYVKILQDKDYIYGNHYLPFDIKARELGTGKSRYEVLQKLLKDKIEIVKQINVKDGINAVRSIFNRCWFDKKKSAPLIDALSHYTKEWDERLGDWKDKPLHDWSSHYADSFRYMSISLDKIIHPMKEGYEKEAQEFIDHNAYKKKYDPGLGMKKDDYARYVKEVKQLIKQ